MAAAPGDGGEFTVVVAGGGIAGLEAILALREAGPPSLQIDLLSPSAEFVIAPLSVVEPFGGDAAPRVNLERFCKEQKADLIRSGLSEVWPGQQRVLTEDGDELPYDALLVCTGARRRTVLESALNFRGSHDAAALEDLVESATSGETGRVAFVVPDEVSWPLPLYELALQVAERLSDADADTEIIFLTNEPSPLDVFGPAASARLATIIADAGIDLRCDEAVTATTMAELNADRVVTVPALDVPEIPGLSQSAHGFVATGPTMKVEGTERVWAVGDVTWTPIKQGGIAAQQADVAAADIAVEAGADVEVPAYAPVLRAALMTGEGPFYLRSGTDEDGGQRAPLWWPPAKVAGRLLAPYLGRRVDPTLVDEELLDLQADEGRDVEHEEALELALRWADLDAAGGEYRRALHWLEVAEGLNLVVPDAYRDKRREWQERIE
jgi:sulfide:quinone oxidoreductase